MSEAYFIAGCQVQADSTLDKLLQSILTVAGIKHNQVDEIHVFSDAASALFQRRLDTAFGPIICWPLIPFLAPSNIISAVRGLEIGDISTCILAENSSLSSSAIFLANPKGVGRFNLTPRVQLANRFSPPGWITEPASWAEKVLSSIPKEEIEPGNDTPDLRIPPPKPTRPWLGVYARQKPVIPGWPEDRLVNGTSIFPSLMKLVDAVNTDSKDAGVWLDIDPEEPCASILVLPV
jgi:hypothetical protein